MSTSGGGVIAGASSSSSNIGDSGPRAGDNSRGLGADTALRVGGTLEIELRRDKVVMRSRAFSTSAPGPNS